MQPVTNPSLVWFGSLLLNFPLFLYSNFIGLFVLTNVTVADYMEVDLCLCVRNNGMLYEQCVSHYSYNIFIHLKDISRVMFTDLMFFHPHKCPLWTFSVLDVTNWHDIWLDFHQFDL